MICTAADPGLDGRFLRTGKGHRNNASVIPDRAVGVYCSVGLVLFCNLMSRHSVLTASFHRSFAGAAPALPLALPLTLAPAYQDEGAQRLMDLRTVLYSQEQAMVRALRWQWVLEYFECGRHVVG